MRILLADDNMDDRAYMRRYLPEAECDEASTISEAIQLAQNNFYDCIVLDYTFPDGTALDCINTIRGNANYTPIVVVTGYGDEKLIVKLFKSKINDYINKDEITDLHTVVREVVEDYMGYERALDSSLSQLKQTSQRLMKKSLVQ